MHSEPKWATDGAGAGGYWVHSAPGCLAFVLLWCVCELLRSKRKQAISSRWGRVGLSPRRSGDTGLEGREDGYLSDKMNFPSLRLGSFLRGLISMYSLLWC